MLNFLWLFLTNVLGKGFAAPGEHWVHQIKTAWQEGPSSDLPGGWNDSSLERRLRKSFSTILPPRVLAKLLVSPWFQENFSKLLWAGEVWVQVGHVKTTRLTVLPDSQQFSQINCIAATLWLISRVLKKSHLTIFANFLKAFVEEMIFRGLYSTIFDDV